MSEIEITIPGGTTITVSRTDRAEREVIFTNPNAPEDMRRVAAGRIARFEGQYGFQPAPFAAFILGTDALRAIAQILEATATEQQGKK